MDECEHFDDRWMIGYWLLVIGYWLLLLINEPVTNEYVFYTYTNVNFSFFFFLFFSNQHIRETLLLF